MVSTNLITFEVSFLNSTETVIVNNSRASLLQLVEKIENEIQHVGQHKNGLQIGIVKEYSRIDSKFKRCSLKRFIDMTDHVTELNVLLNSKK